MQYAPMNSEGEQGNLRAQVVTGFVVRTDANKRFWALYACLSCCELAIHLGELISTPNSAFAMVEVQQCMHGKLSES
jgi:hypothetical protein